jgi:hypothetical protein
MSTEEEALQANTDVEETPSDPPADELDTGAEVDETEGEETSESSDDLAADRAMLNEAKLRAQAAAAVSEHLPKKDDADEDKDPEPTSFDLELSPDDFEEPERAAAAVKQAVTGAVKHLVESNQKQAETIKALRKELETKVDEVRQSQQADPNQEVDRILGELGDDFKDEFGDAPTRTLYSSDPILKKRAELLTEMVLLADARERRTGQRPALDAALARRAMAASDVLKPIVDRIDRKKRRASLNGKAASATPKGQSRKEEPRPKTKEERDEELLNYAEKNWG